MNVKLNGVAFAVALMLGCASSVYAQSSNVFYGQLSTAQKAELKAWNQMFATLVDTGNPAPGAATFSFSNTLMNGPLFAPLVGAARTATNATTGYNSTGCISDASVKGADSAADVETLSYLRDGTISTDLIADPDSTINHLAAVMEDGAAAFDFDGSLLVSHDLTPSSASGTVGEGVYSEAGPTAGWEMALFSYAPTVANGLGQDQEARKDLMDQPRSFRSFRDQMQAWFISQGAEVSCYMVYGTFGTYGSLPIVVASFDSGFYLIDGATGNVDGPYASASTLDAKPLLLAHTEAYVSGTAIEIIDEGGCATAIAATWRATPPPGYTPRPAPPGSPAPAPWTPPGTVTPVSPIMPLVPGWWSPYVCVQITVGCSCTTYGQGTMPNVPPPGSTVVPTRSICTTAVCPSPPQNPPAPPAPGMICTPAYFY